MTYKIHTCNLCDKKISAIDRYINLKCIRPDDSRYEQRVHLKCYNATIGFKPREESEPELKRGNE